MKLKLLLSLLTLYIMLGQSYAQSVKVCVAGQCESGEMKVEDIQRSGGVLIYTSDEDKIGAESFLISYNIGEREFSCQNEGYMFTEECKAFLSSMKVGNRFRLHEIKYGEGMMAPILEFTLVD
ncbi:MAG: hypothetical protein Salg2KO_09510 [Salibacteraceae bacterium]